MLVMNQEVRQQVRGAYEHARKLGPKVVRQFLSQLRWADRYGANTENGVDPVVRKQVEFRLYPDFAPHSFSFCFYRNGQFMFNGGLIYQGPECPADGSFPSLTVTVGDSRRVGWFVHT